MDTSYLRVPLEENCKVCASISDYGSWNLDDMGHLDAARISTPPPLSHFAPMQQLQPQLQQRRLRRGAKRHVFAVRSTYHSRLLSFFPSVHKKARGFLTFTQDFSGDKAGFLGLAK